MKIINEKDEKRIIVCFKSDEEFDPNCGFMPKVVWSKEVHIGCALEIENMKQSKIFR